MPYFLSIVGVDWSFVRQGFKLTESFFAPKAKHDSITLGFLTTMSSHKRSFIVESV